MTKRSPPAESVPDSPTRDEVLKRMLKMRPKPHKPDLANGGKTAKQKPVDPPKKKSK
jgi:hypothetical protein